METKKERRIESNVEVVYGQMIDEKEESFSVGSQTSKIEAPTSSSNNSNQDSSLEMKKFSPLIRPPAAPEPSGELKLANRRFIFNRNMCQKPIVKSMAAQAAKIGANPTAKSSLKPLRQINIVGQLNHSSTKGLLLIVNLIVLLALISSCLVQVQPVAGSLALWPFAANGPSSGSGRQKSWHSSSGAKRSQPTSQQGEEADKHVAVPPPITQQFHYFWNHDQIEPKLVAEEANKVLADAQLQTDQKVMQPMGAASNQADANKRQDGAGAEQSVLVPPAVQQQLTAMVLQMQRQQQLSMMAQPRFDQAGGFSASQRRLSTPLNPMSRLWMSASSQHPVIAAPPGGAGVQSLFGGMFGSESIQHPASFSPLFAGGQQPPVSMRASASMAGVPVFGPFMVAPSPMSGIGFAPQLAPPPAPVKSAAPSANPSTSKLASSLLNRRKSWPLFGLVGGGGGGSGSNGGASEKSSVFAAASQPRPTLAMPQAPAVSAAPALPSVGLASEAVALLDAASIQLIHAIANQMQVKASQQKLVQALASAMEKAQDNQVAGSSSSPQYDTQSGQLQVGQKPGGVLMQPPYTIPPSISVPAQLALEFAASLPALAGAYPRIPINNFDLNTLAFANASGLPFGSRLKRRHLNILAKQPLKKELAKPPYSIEVGSFEDSANLNLVDRDPLEDNLAAAAAANEVNFDSHQTSASSVAPTTIKLKSSAAKQVANEHKRIVKKDSAPLAASKKSQSAEYRQLLMIMSTESPPTELGAGVEQTQLRRLRRSSGLFEQKEASFRGSRSAFKSSSWKSVSESKPDFVVQKSFVAAPSVKIKGSSWAPFSVSNELSDGLIKRQAEMVNSSASINSPAKVTTIAYEIITKPDSFNDQLHRQDRSFKIKKIIGAGSVIHHAASKGGLFPEKTPVRRGVVVSGSPVSLPKPAVFVKPRQAAEQDLSVDPMAAALSESARVINYFQNVENEASSSTTTSTQAPISSTANSFNHQAPEPQLNVGFAAPTKQPSRQSENYPDSNDIRRQQRQPQANSGNSPTRGLTYSESNLALAAGLNGASSDNSGRLQRLSSAQQQQQQLATASSADISSAATGTNRAYVNNNPAPPPQSSPQRIPALEGLSSGQLQMLALSQAGGANLVRAGSSLPQGPLMFKTHNQLMEQSSRLSANSVPIFGATSHNQQSYVAPNSKPASQPAKGQHDERSGSADQSANFNEELMPPAQNSFNSLPGASNVNQSSMFMNEQVANQQQADSLHQQQTDNHQSNYELSTSEQPAHDSNGFGMNENDFGNKNIDSASESSLANLDPSIELARFKQQALMSQQTSQADNLIPEPQLDTSANPNNMAFNQLQQQQQQSPESTPGLTNQQLMSAQSAQPILAQQQYYSQQMQALGAAVNSYNQQRFNQQLREASMLNNNLTPAQLRNSFSDNNPSQLETLRNTAAVYQQLQNSGAIFTPEDETAAANTAAAAGIPTYPSAAQLLALQSHNHNLHDLSNLLMSGSEKREQHGDDENGATKSSSKKTKKKGYKQVSHHYHFNNFGSPFEDQENQFGPLNPLDIAGSLQSQEELKAQQQYKQKTKDNDKQKEEEEEKPKKKSLLRRFSLKNLFKRFRKDKKKENESNDNGTSNNDSSTERRRDV